MNTKPTTNTPWFPVSPATGGSAPLPSTGWKVVDGAENLVACDLEADIAIRIAVDHNNALED